MLTISNLGNRFAAAAAAFALSFVMLNATLDVPPAAQPQIASTYVSAVA